MSMFLASIWVRDNVTDRVRISFRASFRLGLGLSL